jgi:hypothetical protein
LLKEFLISYVLLFLRFIKSGQGVLVAEKLILFIFQNVYSLPHEKQICFSKLISIQLIIWTKKIRKHLLQENLRIEAIIE